DQSLSRSQKPTWLRRLRRGRTPSPRTVLAQYFLRACERSRTLRILRAYLLRRSREGSATYQFGSSRNVLGEQFQNFRGNGCLVFPGSRAQSFVQVFWNIFNVKRGHRASVSLAMH